MLLRITHRGVIQRVRSRRRLAIGFRHCAIAPRRYERRTKSFARSRRTDSYARSPAARSGWVASAAARAHASSMALAGALAEIGRHRVRGVAEERREALAPALIGGRS